MKKEYYTYNSKLLVFEKVNKSNYLKYGALLVGILFLIGMTSAPTIKKVFERVPVIINYSEEPCDTAKVRQYLNTLNLKFPHIVWQQVMVESGYLTSSLCKKQNNLMGMEPATFRPTVGKNLGTRFAYYNNWKESLIDYALWQAYLCKDIKTEEDYYNFLDQVYCPKVLQENKGELYSTRLKRIK